jgi:uncharacterized membrane protein
MKQYLLKIPARFSKGEYLAGTFIMIIYMVGIAGMLLPFTLGIFIRIIPVVIIMSLAISLAFHKGSADLRTISVFFFIVCVSWLLEAAGVRTGLIFGSYIYGDALWTKALGTPLIIGLNWLLLVYGSAALAERIHAGTILRIIAGSMMMLLYDIVLETLAPLLDMWQFSGKVPVRNYTAWFILAIIFHALLRATGIKVNNRIAALIFIVQFVFLLLLSILLHLIK